MARQTETIGYHITAAVPVDRLGRVLKALFDAGCPPLSTDAILGTPGEPIGPNVTMPKQINGTLDPHPLPQQKLRSKTPHISIDQFRPVILAFILSHHPEASRRRDMQKALAEHFGTDGLQARIDTEVSHMVSTGMLIRVANGEVMFSKTGLANVRKQQESEPAPGLPPPPPSLMAGTGKHIIYEIIKSQPTHLWDYTEIKEAYKNAGRNPNSVKDTLMHLYKAGLIKRVRQGVYQLPPTNGVA